jgi:G3E family GTPase
VDSLSIDGVSNLSIPAVIVDRDDGRSKESLDAARKALLRSKGFVWLATSKAAAYFVSHAGQYLEMSIMGRWWADIEKTQWPTGMDTDIVKVGYNC